MFNDNQDGFVFPAALITLALAAFLTVPFLTQGGSGLVISSDYAAAIGGQYAADAGVEHAVWRLTDDGLGALIPNPGDEITYQPTAAINGVKPSVTVTTVSPGGDVAGGISNIILDELEFDVDTTFEPNVVHVSGEVYAIAYRGDRNDGFVTTVQIASDGQIAASTIDTLEFDTSNGYEPDIIHVSGEIYAIAYRGTGSDGFVTTVGIAADGQIGNSVIDMLEFDASNGYTPSIVSVSGDVYAIAYRGSGSDGFVTTVQIAGDGQIGNSVIDILEYDTSSGINPDIIHVSGDVYAIAYTGAGSDGWLSTIEIASNGQITNSVIDTLEFEPSSGNEPNIIHLSGDIYAIAYRDPSNTGAVATVEIAADGQITDPVIAALVFDASAAYEPAMIHVADDVYAIAYEGLGSDGFVTTVEIAADGLSLSVIDTFEFDTGNGQDNIIIQIFGDVFAVAYSGPGSDGFLKTLEILRSGSGGAAEYQIVSDAGADTITAIVTIDGSTVGITSWQVE